MEQRKSYKDEKRNAQAGQTPVRRNTNAMYDGGFNRSSKEVSVMGMERRVEVVQLKMPFTTLNNQGMTDVSLTKGFPITQDMVIEAYRKVRSNDGSAGIDRETIEEYEKQLKSNLYCLWNRMSSGSYFPQPVLEVEIPKRDGNKRKLGIPTVNDRVAQQVVKSYLEPRLEREFVNSSYGYRPLKSAHQAVEAVRKNVREYRWVIDMDISKFFDKMSHDLLMKAIDKHVTEKWVKMYIERWLIAPIGKKNGEQIQKKGEGTPQGGVISPLLSNLFLHYAFDKWFIKTYPKLSFVRYADDIVVHCDNQDEAQEVQESIKRRLKECKLQLNEEKTHIVYCKSARRKAMFKTVKFDFLGFSFQPRSTATEEGKMFLGFDCSISKNSEKKILKEIRESKFHKWTQSSIERIAEEFNPKIQGWINYYGRFRKYNLMRIFSHFNWRLIKWGVNRYKRFKGSMRQSGKWLRRFTKENPKLFVHWQHGFQTA
jgi:group II intron reverse transcriptase/maturase